MSPKFTQILRRKAIAPTQSNEGHIYNNKCVKYLITMVKTLTLKSFRFDVII